MWNGTPLPVWDICYGVQALPSTPGTPRTRSRLGCPSKLVSIRNNQNWNRNQFRHYPKQNVCFGCFASIPKQRVSMFRLNHNKEKTNPKQFDRVHILVFSWKFKVVSVCFALFRNCSVCFNCFDIGSKHRNKLKQTEFFCFWFHDTNRNKTETDLASVCFCSNQNFFCLFRRHPIIQAFYDDCEGTGRRYASLQHKVLVSPKTPLGMKESMKIRIFFFLVYLKKQCCGVALDMGWI